MNTYRPKNALHPAAVIILHQAPRHLSVKQHTITHSLHPLPDRDRYRVANATSVRVVPPLGVTPLLILRVIVSANKAERSGGSDRDRTYCDLRRRSYSPLPYHYGGTSKIFTIYKPTGISVYMCISSPAGPLNFNTPSNLAGQTQLAYIW